MKTLITILILTSSLCYGQDYATTEAELKCRKRMADSKVLTGLSVIFLGILAIANDNPETKQSTDRFGGAAVGVGATIAIAGIIENKEIKKEKRALKFKKHEKN